MRTIRQKHKISATAEELYIALTNPFTIELWTGYKAKMSTEPGSEFSLWEGDIVGKNLEFETNKKIIQEWYFGEQQEKSIVTITLQQEKESTLVDMVHTNVPESELEEMKTGWKNYYWGSLKKFFK